MGHGHNGLSAGILGLGWLERGIGLGMCGDGRLGMCCAPGVGSGSESWMELTVIVVLTCGCSQREVSHFHVKLSIPLTNPANAAELGKLAVQE